MPKWNEYQEAIFQFVENIQQQPLDLCIDAKAGTGKTTTMVEAAHRLWLKNPKIRILLCAFNKQNADELNVRLAALGIPWKQVHGKTLNSVGLGCVKKNAGKGNSIQVEPRKGRMIAKSLAKEYNLNNPDDQIDGLAGKVNRLAELAKATLTRSNNDYEMRGLCWEHMISCDSDEIDVLIELAGRAMTFSAMDKNTVDFTDMIWFPYHFKQWPWQYDVVIVDEAQDQNAAMLSLARKSKKRSVGRLIIVGDPHQAIYAWRGADSEFMERASQDMHVLSLPRTYRCGKLIVEEARRLVPGFEAAEGNVDGVVRSAAFSEMLDEAVPGDFLISRTNAPLMDICIGFLKQDRPATIQGRDIMGALISIIHHSLDETDGETEDIEPFMQWLENYKKEETAKLELLDAEEKQIEALVDRCECLRVLSVECDTTQCLIDKLNELFSDEDDDNKIVLTTAHRSKGLERDRVWLLEETFKAERGGQEANCLYVAITRAKNELVYVT